MKNLLYILVCGLLLTLIPTFASAQNLTTNCVLKPAEGRTQTEKVKNIQLRLVQTGFLNEEDFVYGRWNNATHEAWWEAYGDCAQNSSRWANLEPKSATQARITELEKRVEILETRNNSTTPTSLPSTETVIQVKGLDSLAHYAYRAGAAERELKLLKGKGQVVKSDSTTESQTPNAQKETVKEKDSSQATTGLQFVNNVTKGNWFAVTEASGFYCISGIYSETEGLMEAHLGRMTRIGSVGVKGGLRADAWARDNDIYNLKRNIPQFSGYHGLRKFVYINYQPLLNDSSFRVSLDLGLSVPVNITTPKYGEYLGNDQRLGVGITWEKDLKRITIIGTSELTWSPQTKYGSGIGSLQIAVPLGPISFRPGIAIQGTKGYDGLSWSNLGLMEITGQWEPTERVALQGFATIAADAGGFLGTTQRTDYFVRFGVRGFFN